MTNESHNEIMRSLGNIEGKIDGLKSDIQGHATILNEHDNQLVDLNLWRANIKGMITIITIIAGAAASAAVPPVADVIFFSWIKNLFNQAYANF